MEKSGAPAGERVFSSIFLCDGGGIKKENWDAEKHPLACLRVRRLTIRRVITANVTDNLFPAIAVS